MVGPFEAVFEVGKRHSSQLWAGKRMRMAAPRSNPLSGARRWV